MWLVYLYNSQTTFSLLLSPSQISTSSSSALLDRKIEEATAGLEASFAKKLRSISEGNASIIVEYIATMKSEVNLSDHYRRDVIVTLCRFSKFCSDKPFKDSTRLDAVAFLDSFRKPVDPLHKWIGTYNIFREHLLRFFRVVFSVVVATSPSNDIDRNIKARFCLFFISTAKRLSFINEQKFKYISAQIIRRKIYYQSARILFTFFLDRTLSLVRQPPAVTGCGVWLVYL